MRFMLISCCLIFLCLLAGAKNVSAQGFENIVQVNGVVITSDSLRAVGDATIVVKNKNRGVESEVSGVFSIVCYKGDTLQFSCIGFRSKEFVISKELKGQYCTVVQPMVQDTFYLPETIIRPLPSKEAFNYAFVHWRIPNDYYEKARRNTNAYLLKALAYTLPRDGQESQARQMAQQAWGQFFEAWKRGDFRKTDNPYMSDSY